jgi:hypothetical protein
MMLIGKYEGSKFLVYALCDPRTCEIRYIGASCRGLHRPRGHTVPSGWLDGSPRAAWCKRLAADGLRPAVVVLAEASNADEVKSLEVEAIASYRAQGARLLNRSLGGTGLHAGKKDRVRCKSVDEFLEAARQKLIYRAIREWHTYERLREEETNMLERYRGGADDR